MKHHIITLLCLFLAIAILAQFTSVDSNRCLLSVTNADGGFQFTVEELPTGKHSYRASLASPSLLLQSQTMSGALPESDWRVLFTLQQTDSPDIPSYICPTIDDPKEKWGSLERQGQRIPLRNCEWWILQRTQVGKSFEAMMFKMKASL